MPLGPAAPRGDSVARILELKWDHPVYAPTGAAHSDATTQKSAREALTRDQALHVIAGKDPRPLLVLRECARCNKTDDALLVPGYDNEKVLFLSRWFHCVKLPVDVIQAEHPFHALFPSNDAEHLFVSSLDGALKVPLESDTSRVELCAAMSQVLSTAYVKDPTPLFKELHGLGDHLDVLDQKIKELSAKKADLMESRGADSKGADKRKVAKIDSEIDAIKKEIADKVGAFEKTLKIELRGSAAPEKGAKDPKAENFERSLR